MHDFTDAEIRAVFNERYPALQTGVIYCLFTGAIIGEIDSYDWQHLIELLHGDSLEACADELAMRILAASRPSIVWNHVDPADIVILRDRRPVETLAYLLNGCKGVPKDKRFMDTMLERIEQYQRLDDMSEEALSAAYMDYHMREAATQETAARFERRMQLWLESCTPEGREAERRKRIQAIENHADAIRLRKELRAKGKLPSAAEVKRKAKEARINSAWSTLETILAGAGTQTTPAPAPVNQADRPVGFTIKLGNKQ